MKYFLLVYDRPRGALLREEEYPSSESAMAARFAAERENKGNDDIEVVVLVSDSQETIRRTHGRYFKTLKELFTELREAVG